MKFTDAVGEAWEELKDDKSDVTYVLVGYDDKKTIGLKGKGPGGRKACLALCGSDSDIVFGGFRVTAVDDRSNTTSRRTKFVFFHYQAPNAPMMAKAKAGGHRAECERVMSGSHVQFQVDGLHELSEAEIVAKLRRCGGAHQPTGFDFGEGDVGEGSAEAAPEAAPAMNARDFAQDNVKAPLDAAAEHAARAKEYQTANVLNSSANAAAKAAAAPAATPPPPPPTAAMAAATIAAPAAPPAAAAAPPGGDGVVLLVTSMPSTSVIDGAQNFLRNIFRGKKIPVEEIDGLKPENKEARSELFACSGLRGQYPQVFTRAGGALAFVGDFEKIQSLNDCEDLPADVLAANPAIETFSAVFKAYMG